MIQQHKYLTEMDHIFRQKLALSAKRDLFWLISAFGRKSSSEIPLFQFRQKVFWLISMTMISVL